MKYLRFMAIGAATAITLAVTAMIVGVPAANVTTSASPAVVEAQRIRLDYGSVTLHQTIILPQPPPNELAIRLWVQRLPAYVPYLTVYGSSGNRTYGPAVVELPPPDGAFHPVELPWWQMASNANSISLAVKGDGVLVLTTTPADNLAPSLKVNGVSRPESALAVQLTGRRGGLEQYVPLLRIAEGKPGILGWPKLLPVLLVAVMVTLAAFSRIRSRLIRLAEQAYHEQISASGASKTNAP